MIRNSEQIRKVFQNQFAHDFRWYEMRANRHAKKYFEEYYDVNWNTAYKGYDYETFYPTIKRY